MQTLTVAELRRQLDLLDPPPDADVVFRAPGHPLARMYATPIISVSVVHLTDEERLVELSTDVAATWQ